MTNKKLTLIGALIDRSGSMESIKEDTQGGYKSFMEEQKNTMQPGEEIECWLSQFDASYDSVFQKTDIKDLPAYELHPRSTTALVDSLHRFIAEIGEDLASRKEEERPDKVIILVLTDGLENSSREVSATQLKDKIKEQEEKYDWNFIFLGANIDAVSTAANYGISADRSITYDAGARGVQAVFKAAAGVTTTMRSGNASAAGFSEADRKGALEK